MSLMLTKAHNLTAKKRKARKVQQGMEASFDAYLGKDILENIAG